MQRGFHRRPRTKDLSRTIRLQHQSVKLSVPFRQVRIVLLVRDLVVRGSFFKREQLLGLLSFHSDFVIQHVVELTFVCYYSLHVILNLILRHRQQHLLLFLETDFTRVELR